MATRNENDAADAALALLARDDSTRYLSFVLGMLTLESNEGRDIAKRDAHSARLAAQETATIRPGK